MFGYYVDLRIRDKIVLGKVVNFGLFLVGDLNKIKILMVILLFNLINIIEFKILVVG